MYTVQCALYSLQCMGIHNVGILKGRYLRVDNEVEIGYDHRRRIAALIH